MKSKLKYSMLVLGIALMSQGCSKAKYSPEESFKSLANNEDPISSSSKSKACSMNEVPDYIAKLDQQAADSTVYSQLSVYGSFGEEMLYSQYVNRISIEFKAFPSPDFKSRDRLLKYDGYQNNEVSPNSGTLSKALGILGIAAKEQKLTYCQAQALCNELFKSRSDWKTFTCSLQQVEYSPAGYVSNDPYNIQGHLREGKLFNIFISNESYASTCDPTVSGGLWLAANVNGAPASRGGAACTPMVELKKMAADGDLIFNF